MEARSTCFKPMPLASGVGGSSHTAGFVDGSGWMDSFRFDRASRQAAALVDLPDGIDQGVSVGSGSWD
jgi:hypothetical protein